MTHLFRLHHLVITLRCEPDALREHVADILRYKGAVEETGAIDTSREADLQLTFTQDSATGFHPDDAEHVGAFGPHLDTYRIGYTFYLAGPGILLEVDLDAASAHARFAPVLLLDEDADAARQKVYYPLTFALTVLLREHDLYGLHGAALARNGTGLLMAASSDSGKTTAALSLIRQGWRFVSDDALLLQKQSGRIDALSFRRAFSLDPHATDYFPELQRHEWPPSPSDPTKFRVDVAALFPGSFQPRCTPRVILLPSLTDRRESRLEELDPLATFEHLMAQSALLAAPLPDRVGAQMAILALLLSQSRTYRLQTGRDVLDRPERFSDMLAETL